jgi:hypothetical protein
MKLQFTAALAPVFQGDLQTSLHRLAALPAQGLDAKQQRTRSCMLARHSDSNVVPDEYLPAPAPAALKAFRHYWTSVLLKQASIEQAEAELSRALTPLLADAGKSSGVRDLDALVEAVAATIESRGLFVLGGVTPPLRELMLWRRQTPTRETVTLPDGAVDVQVTLLGDFASLGWAAWATCDHSHAAGWTTSEGIMVVTPAWKLDSEEYRVSLLSHEAQHFGDYKRFPKLSSPDLEYRAKLVEIALADNTQRQLLQGFGVEAKRDRSTPHPFASFWVVERLRIRLGTDRWQDFTRPAIRDAALAELGLHADTLSTLGSQTAETALPD